MVVLILKSNDLFSEKLQRGWSPISLSICGLPAIHTIRHLSPSMQMPDMEVMKVTTGMGGGSRDCTDSSEMPGRIQLSSWQDEASSHLGMEQLCDRDCTGLLQDSPM